jgi:hypothetical protein
MSLCLVCESHQSTHYTQCCAAYICQSCADNMQEDKVCICNITTAPVIIPADHSILDPASIRHAHQQQVAAFHNFLTSIANATWKLDISKQDWINSQHKLIAIADDIVSRIQTFPHMPHTYQYVFTKPGLLVKNREGQAAIIPRAVLFTYALNVYKI